MAKAIIGYLLPLISNEDDVAVLQEFPYYEYNGSIQWGCDEYSKWTSLFEKNNLTVIEPYKKGLNVTVAVVPKQKSVWKKTDGDDCKTSFKDGYLNKYIELLKEFRILGIHLPSSSVLLPLLYGMGEADRPDLILGDFNSGDYVIKNRWDIEREYERQQYRKLINVYGYRWDDSCIKATLLLHAKTEHEIEEINWKYELRKPLFEKNDLVEFYFDNGKKKTKCKGVIAGTDIYRIHGKIETIEYDIWGEDYETYRKKCLYKHIDEKHIKATPGKLLILSGFSGVGNGSVIQQLLTEYPEKYVVSVSATTRKPRKGEVDGKSYHFKKREEFEDLINKNEFLEFIEYAGEYYGTLKKDVYKSYFKGKNVIIEIDSQGARQIRQKQKIQSVFLIPPSFEELLHRLKNRGTESKESIHRRLKQALDEIEHIEEYGVLLVNDSVEGTAFVIDALFHPVLKNASGMNERELKIAREIREGIIKYLFDEEGE